MVFLNSISHMRSYHMARKVQPGQDRKLTAALFVLSLLPKQGMIRQSLSLGKVDYDSIARVVKDRDVVFFARGLPRLSLGDLTLHVSRLKKKYQASAFKAVKFVRSDFNWEVLQEDVLPALIGKGGDIYYFCSSTSF